MGRGATLSRRRALGAAAVLPWIASGCGERAPALPPVRWVGASQAHGHALRGPWVAPAEARQRRADVLIVGGGVAGLGAARALLAAGIEDIALLELEDEAGGNARGHHIAGIDCPLGAHYLPLPGAHAHEVAELLDTLGLRRMVAGAPQIDERHMCHAPQERLFIDGAWHEGLLPPVEALPQAERDATLAQYRRFAALVHEAGAGGTAFRVPSARAVWTPALAALDARSFADWLDSHRLDAPALRWALDYACRDDYGASAAMVSAWAGVHYFASRHGFAAPGDGDADNDPVLTWPEGNAHLTRRMAAPLAARIHAGRLVRRVAAGRSGVVLDADVATGAPERWQACAVVLALPLFIAARLLADPPEALRQAVAAMHWAPWLVANLHVDRPPITRPGLAAAWDSVRYGAIDLGYVDAMHQSTRPHAGPTVLTAYHALGGDSLAASDSARRQLLDATPEAWAQRVLADLAPLHPDLPQRVTQIDLMRYGHAMSVPRPGVHGHAALRALAAATGPVQLAHSDLAGYSVFEEALFHGTRAAAAVVAMLRG